ncbi:hypothetical protein ACLI08_04635 [Flavobacterium sp. RNTU_13]|uniref:hypothetical protein n=1 Tax=Flavobacterium sp. RNTU_13 TaxID=3375145 RepID=UPI00398734AA
MHVIRTVNSKRFSLNGIEYLKNYITHVSGNQLEIFNCYDRADVLLPLTHYNQFMVNGSVYNSASQLQSALADVLYVRTTLGAVAADINQDNIDLVRRLTISAFSMANVLNAINNGPAFTVNEKQSVWFAISVIPSSRRGTKSIYKYKMTGLGKGDYGAPNGSNSPTPLTAANLELVYYSVLDSDLIYQAPSTININLGTINLPLISSVINQRPVNAPLSFDSITERFTVLEATYNGAVQRRLWVGGTGKYGQGAQQVTEDDLEVIPEPVATPSVPTYTQVLNAGPLSNAYAIHYGSLNQNTTGYGTDIKYSNPDGNSIIVEFEDPVATVKRIVPTGAADDYFALRSEVNKPVKQINDEDPNVVNGVYALTVADTNYWLSFNNTIALTVHIPEEVFSAGTLIEGDASGTAQVSFTAAPNVTLQQPTGELARTAGQYSVFGIKFRSASEALLFGRLELI